MSQIEVDDLMKKPSRRKVAIASLLAGLVIPEEWRVIIHEVISLVLGGLA